MTSEWKKFEIKIPGKDIFKQVRSVLETLLVFLEILKAILETVKLFLIDFGNPIKSLVQALIKTILNLFEALRQTGIYALFDIPDFTKDTSLKSFCTGYKGFTTRFKESLNNTNDPFRPQFAPGTMKSGFIMIVVDASTIYDLIRKLQMLMRFFGMNFETPTYPAPANIKALPIGAKGDPILAIPKVFGVDITGIAVEWSTPSSVGSSAPGFQNLSSTLASEFIPQKWLIERTTKPLKDTVMTAQVDTGFESRGKAVKRKVKVRERNGDIFRRFENYWVIEPSVSGEGVSFLLGQLGTFRWVDRSVKKDTMYYYRVRAISGTPAITSDQTINWSEPKYDTQTKETLMEYPSADGNPLVMGKPSPVVQAKIPDVPANFDVIENLRKIFLTGFGLGFHLPVSPDAEFDSEGRNTGGTTPAQVGRGLLNRWAGPVSAIFPVTLTDVPQADVHGSYPKLTTDKFMCKWQARNLAVQVASAMLANPGGNAHQFKAFMEAPFKYPQSDPAGYLASAKTRQDLVFRYCETSEKFPDEPDPRHYLTVRFADVDVNFRLNVKEMVTFALNFTAVSDPHWIQVSLLKDIIPWAGQLLYELVAKIQALVDAFNGMMKEIRDFIDLLIRKIDTMEKFIKFLLSILDVIQSLSISAHILQVGPVEGGTPEWMQLVDSAEGDKPSSGPNGYTAGVVLGYGMVDPGAFIKAFKLIF